MKKSYKAKTSQSMLRSKRKKKMKLPTPAFYDPFIGVVHINKNGRIVREG